MEALVNIRAAGRLANGVKIAPPQIGFERMQRLEVASRFAGPFGEPGSGLFNLNQRHASLVFLQEGLEARAFQVRPGLAEACGVEWSYQDADSLFVGARGKAGSAGLCVQRVDDAPIPGALASRDPPLRAR